MIYGERIKIASELVRIAEDVSPNEAFVKIDGMTVPELLDVLKNNKNALKLMTNIYFGKYSKSLDVSQPLRGMTVKQVLQMLAKIGVLSENEKKGIKNEQAE